MRDFGSNQTLNDFMAQAHRETTGLVGIASVGKCLKLRTSGRLYKALAERGALLYSASQLMEAFSALQSWMENEGFERFPTLQEILENSTSGSALLSRWNEWARATAWCAEAWLKHAPLTDAELDQVQAHASQLA